MSELEFQLVKTNGMTLHAVTAGPRNGPLVVLLHGFPEFWYGWRHQIKPLAEAGYRVLVPDQRGFNKSQKPEGIEPYTLDTLRDDVIGLIKLYNRKKAHIIGHDWGGAVAWHLASTRPEYVETLIAINIPHPAIMPKAMLTLPLQWLRSSYMAFFQLPEWPEKLLSADGFDGMAKGIKLSASTNQAFTQEDLDKYKEAWAKPGAMTAMLNWYRAIRAGLPEGFAQPERIQVPTQIIWGVNDPFLSKKLAKKSIEHCENGKLTFVGEATHWVNHEQPMIVNQLIANHLKVVGS
ncbi:alpha/beta fold hydrolase [Alkalicoccobacillus porphyridii]|uniref:Alpha/beta hydrolase n=1 Tax=Alkalicoccobacillus porphyridii TaxID=2597270 RepID=A0A553ZVC8_9BACI|nr:alpha/beta hydrolase [Alkalicoccobacillus porphyridii]TSB45438.1 alpha/beta hydrolase [Alkalicoccobacillus porphyridii]